MSVMFMAPEETPRHKLFLAGSIDMGAAINWQETVYNSLKDLPVMIFNPRRDDWDSSWVQSINDPKFNQQVSWELEHMEEADMICFFFDPNGKSPITLMELGLHAMSGKKIVVCCPNGFWRKGNIEMVCDRYSIPLYDKLSDMIAHIIKWVVQ